MTLYLMLGAMTYGLILGVFIGNKEKVLVLGALFWAAIWPVCWVWVGLKLHRSKGGV